VTQDNDAAVRKADLISYIDMGFLNRRLAISALGPMRERFLNDQVPGDDHMTVLRNDHWLVGLLIQVCEKMKAPSLADALTNKVSKQIFMSTERLEPCPEVYDDPRVTQGVKLEFPREKPVRLAYHTSHFVSDTGKMTLAAGYVEDHREAIVGLLHEREDHFEIEPIVIGAPMLQTDKDSEGLDVSWSGSEYGELLPEDIDEFSQLSTVKNVDADEWLNAMKAIPEQHIKESFAKLLTEPVKADWGGEENDHFSANLHVGGRRKTAAFLLKGPTRFAEMTPAMCGKNGDQIYRLTKAGADISLIQHAHLVGPAVREQLRAMVVGPGRSRKFCIIDGQATYRILKAYNLLP
jgi:hypothetical protein